MKRFVVFIILFSLLTLCAAWLANATAISVLNSKHNLSSDDIVSTGTGSIKSLLTSLGGTSEVCVFCHTPHGGNTQAPLWNKTASVESYSTYTSDVLAGLGYWAAEDPKTGVPHIKTRICLSCHDGTIALGSLVNLPNEVTEAQVPMEGTTGALTQYGMPPTAAGYIGTNLKDDHPVAIKYDTSDPELQSISGESAVRLYDTAAKPTKNNQDYVECTSCHDPHDNQWGHFLVESNQNSALCLRCHSKQGFSGSAHDDTSISVAYAPPTDAPAAGGNPANHGPNVGHVKCMSCHFPHKAGVTAASPTAPNPGSGMYLLSFREEASCFNDNDRFGLTNVAACHGNSAPAGKRLIEPELASASRHNIGNYADKHQSLEVTSGTSNGWFVSSAWHVECADCHNPHTAGTALHTQGSNTVNSTVTPYSALYGVAYASVSGGYPAASWAAPNSFTAVEPLGATLSTSWGGTPVKEYEICFKCHSNFASNGGSFPNAYSTPQQMSDQSKEFNVDNSMGSFHPVVTSNTNTWGAMVNGWNLNSQLMYCSDCHTKENLNNPRGPHGSSNSYILPYLYYDDYAASGSGDDLSGTLCLQCHDPDTYASGSGTNTGFYSTGGTNLHQQHYTKRNNPTSPWAYRCVNCHIRTPHGWDRKGLIHKQGDDASHSNGNWYEPVSGPTITGFVGGNLPATRAYGINKGDNCFTINGCHQN